MNRFYKIIEDNIILSIGVNIGLGVEITENEYNHLDKILSDIPTETETHYYAVNTETLEYELIERDEPIIIPDPRQFLVDEIIAEVNA
ncbi:MAG: hypothetical protein IJB73_04170 [Firmicutes bacterium]|nr:hypothetical protein [Bacillota bacterium]MBQ6899880.1 hypothetical protein [Bacillota bacterium]